MAHGGWKSADITRHYSREADFMQKSTAATALTTVTATGRVNHRLTVWGAHSKSVTLHHYQGLLSDVGVWVNNHHDQGRKGRSTFTPCKADNQE